MANKENNKEPAPPTQKISLYKIRIPELFDHEKLVAKGFSKEFENDTTKIFLLKDRRSTPKWSTHLLKDYQIPQIYNISNSFILTYSTEKNLYAACGGYGYKYIKDDYEDDFGLELATRLISDDESISAFHQRALNGSIKQLYQAVKGYNPNFDTENYNRILRFIEGKSLFEGRAYKISGRSALTIRTERGLGNIGELIKDIEKQLQAPAKVSFPKTFKQVTNGALISELESHFNKEAVDFINGKLPDTEISIELDDFTKQISCEEFKVNFNKKRAILNELDIYELKEKIQALTENTKIDIGDLEKINISAKDSHGEAILDHSPLTKTCVFELQKNNSNYLKLNKAWFEIHKEFQEYINEMIRDINVTRNILPEWDNNTFAEEGDYNKFVANKNNLLLTDAKFVYLKGKNKIEVCDLFDPKTKSFYHIKKAWGSKSSYFFSQAAVSTETYRKSKLFKNNIANKWPSEFENVKLDNANIIIAMAIEEEKHADFPNNLPYFSKLCLANTASRIVSCKANVTLTPIKLLPKN